MRTTSPLDRVAELELRRRAFCILAFPQWCREASSLRDETRVTGAGARTASFAVPYPRREPCAGIPLARIWARAVSNDHPYRASL